MTKDRSDVAVPIERKPMRISIVTPTRNASKFIRSCLDSVAAQRDPTCNVEVEHLILDGNSQDNTLEIAGGYDVTFIPRPPQMGLVPAICLGFEHATGDLIAFLGADDVLLPNALRKVAQVYAKERREVIFGCSRWVTEDTRSLGELVPLPRWWNASQHASLGWCYATASATFVTPDLYRMLGGFDQSFTKLEDYEFVNRILAERVPFSRIHQAISLYRRHDDNESLQQDTTYWADLDEIHKRYAPKSRFIRLLNGLLLKSWIYARNPIWGWHQIQGKIRNRRLTR